MEKQVTKPLSDCSNSVGLVPKLGFETLAVELIHGIFAYLSLPQLCKSLKRVCCYFELLTSADQSSLWKNILEQDWKKINTPYRSEKITSMEQIKYSLRKRGYFAVAKSLWLQRYNKECDWLIQIKHLTVYQGQCNKDGEPHGRGLGTLCGRDFYEGEWSMGQKEGEGIVMFASGYVYKAKWKRNAFKKEGLEILKRDTGDLEKFLEEWYRRE